MNGFNENFFLSISCCRLNSVKIILAAYHDITSIDAAEPVLDSIGAVKQLIQMKARDFCIIVVFIICIKFF